MKATARPVELRRWATRLLQSVRARGQARMTVANHNGSPKKSRRSLIWLSAASRAGQHRDEIARSLAATKSSVSPTSYRRYGGAVDLKRAADLYAQGRTLRQIGAELGVHWSTVSQQLQSAGITMRLRRCSRSASLHAADCGAA
jgi:hypothetical protein